MTKEKLFVIIGSVDSEGATSRLKASGVTYINKILLSSVENWRSINRLLSKESVVGALIKINSGSLSLFLLDEYGDASEVMLQRLSSTRHLMFIHESFFSAGSAVPVDFEEHFPISKKSYAQSYGFSSLTQKERDQFTDKVKFYKLNIVSYNTNAELSVLVTDFVDQSERNLIFRIYVSNDRLWAAESGKLISLFREYLGKIGKVKINQEQYATSQGTVYELYAEEDVNPASLPEKFVQFSDFMDLCISNPNEATALLQSLNVDNRTVYDIVARYSKEARRLQVDMRQERERRVLHIRHNMESELVDAGDPPLEWSQIEGLVERTIPSARLALPALMSTADTAETKSLAQQRNQSSIDRIENYVRSDVKGLKSLSSDASNLIAVVDKYGEQSSAQLTSDVQELEDNEARQADRLAAKSRLKRFLYSVSNKAGDLAISVAQKYIESKIGL